MNQTSDNVLQELRKWPKTERDEKDEIIVSHDLRCRIIGTITGVSTLNNGMADAVKTGPEKLENQAKEKKISEKTSANQGKEARRRLEQVPG
jgi:hypothetical protein